MSEDPPKERRALNPAFARRNALVKDGWLAELSGIELAVWTVYDCYADANNIAYPGAKRIADALGHSSVSHVKKARQELIKLGLLVPVDGTCKGGAGKGKYAMVIRALIKRPPKPTRKPKTDERKEAGRALNQRPGNGAGSGIGADAEPVAPPTESAPGAGAESAKPSIYSEHPIEQPNNNSSSSNAAAATDAEIFSCAEDEEKLRWIDSHTIGSPVREEFSGMAGLNVKILDFIYGGLSPRSKGNVAILISAIRRDAPRLIKNGLPKGAAEENMRAYRELQSKADAEGCRRAEEEEREKRILAALQPLNLSQIAELRDAVAAAIEAGSLPEFAPESAATLRNTLAGYVFVRLERSPKMAALFYDFAVEKKLIQPSVQPPQ